MSHYISACVTLLLFYLQILFERAKETLKCFISLGGRNFQQEQMGFTQFVGLGGSLPPPESGLGSFLIS